MPDPLGRLNAALDGRYRVERQLGEGGMATVYLARDLKHNRNVALKVLKPELAAVVGAERFLAEIETTANLQHPHILPLFDSGEAGGFVYYVMPYVDGETLRVRLDRDKQLPVDEAVRIATNVAEALDYAHSRGIVHRDIKPANILLQAGKPVISDFGIALAVGAAGGGRLTETGLSLGTPHYMSPEQATGDQGVGAATDIYALGCVLYEMLVGDPPYVGSTAQAILGKIVTGAADPVTKHRRAVPPNVDGAIRKALERLPADRFAGALDFARALGQPGFRYGKPATRATGASAGAWKAVALVLAVLLAASTAALTWSLLRPEPPRPVARFESPFRAGQIPRGPIEFTPDGSALVYVAASPSGRSPQLWIRRLDDPAARPIAGTEGVYGNTYLEFSPDGREVAFAGGSPPALKVVPLEGGPARQLAPSSIGAHGWTSDGTLYFQSGQDLAIHRVPATGGGEPEVVTELADGEQAHDALRFLPGGRMAVFTVYAPDDDASAPEVWALDLETGQRRMLTQGTAPRYTSTEHLLYVRADGMLMAAPIDEDAEIGPAVSLFGGIQVVSGVARYAVSSTGALAYIAGGIQENRTSLVWVDREGREQPLPLESQVYTYPRISPDGGRLAVAVVADDADLWVFDLDRLTRSRITYGGDNRYFPVWSPSGDRVAFSSGPVNGNALLAAAADGSGRTDTLLARDGLQFPTSWSGDGRILAFYERHPDRAENGRDMWMMPLDGEPEPFLVTPFEERAPVFSPDGRWLAYASSKSGRDEVYLQPFPGPGREIVLSTGGGTEPVWSPDGSELFYRSDDEMMAVDLTDPTSPGSPEPLFGDPYLRDPSGNAAQNYDVHGDGPRFLMVRLEEANPGQVNVVLNWFEELREQVPR